MAEAFKVEGAGNWAQVIGFGVQFHCILATLKADRDPLAILRVGASYADDHPDKPYLTGRLLILREPMKGENALLDPAGIDTGGASKNLLLAFDQFIHEKGFREYVTPLRPFIVPQGQIWQVLLTSAYTEGDPFAQPAPKRAKLLIDTEVGGTQSYKLETYE